MRWVWEYLTHLALRASPKPEVTRVDDFIDALPLGHLQGLMLGPLPRPLLAAFDATLSESVFVSYDTAKG